MSAIKFSVIQQGKALDKRKYSWDKTTKTFATKERDLFIDFSGIDDCTFNAGAYCTFKTGAGCTFKTGACCTFKTGSDCTFNTGSYCTFKTGADCTFDTGAYCTFKTGAYCTFKTGADCTFNTSADCTFKTGADCIFESGQNSVVVRRDIFQVIQLVPKQKIKLNSHRVKGYTVIDSEPVKPTCNGKVVEIDGKKYKLMEVA